MKLCHFAKSISGVTFHLLPTRSSDSRKVKSTSNLFFNAFNGTAGPVGNTRQKNSFLSPSICNLRSNRAWKKPKNQFLCGWSSKDKRNTQDEGGGVSSS